jgi:hypothetical protein
LQVLLTTAVLTMAVLTTAVLTAVVLTTAVLTTAVLMGGSSRYESGRALRRAAKWTSTLLE